MIGIFLLFLGGEPAPIIMELFTSQGCSSCPPADQFLAKFNDQNPDVILLSYHVDYWDYLGWKDPFALTSASKRQRSLAATLKDSVYTPQVVIAGRFSGVGSDEAFVLHSITKSRAGVPQILAWERAETGQYVVKPNQVGTLHYAYLRKSAKSKVLRGENRGRTLFNRNVVLEYGQIEKSNLLQARADADVLVVWQTDTELGPIIASVLIPIKANR